MGALPRKRIGTRLIEAVIAEAKKNGIARCGLNVHVGNSAAIGLYRSMGFKIKATIEGYYHRSASKLDGPPDAHLMQCCIADAPVARPIDDGAEIVTVPVDKPETS